jgi:hypothetical protein
VRKIVSPFFFFSWFIVNGFTRSGRLSCQHCTQAKKRCALTEEGSRKRKKTEETEKPKGKGKEKEVTEDYGDEGEIRRNKKRRTAIEKEESEWRRWVTDYFKRNEEREDRRDRREKRREKREEQVELMIYRLVNRNEKIVEMLKTMMKMDEGTDTEEEDGDGDRDEEMAVVEAVAEGSGVQRETEENGGNGETEGNGGDGKTGGNGETEQGGDVEMA